MPIEAAKVALARAKETHSPDEIGRMRASDKLLQALKDAADEAKLSATLTNAYGAADELTVWAASSASARFMFDRDVLYVAPGKPGEQIELKLPKLGAVAQVTVRLVYNPESETFEARDEYGDDYTAVDVLAAFAAERLALKR
jgi:hypothetical protein